MISKNKKVFDCAKDRLMRETGQDLSYFHEKTISELAARKLERQQSINMEKNNAD